MLGIVGVPRLHQFRLYLRSGRQSHEPGKQGGTAWVPSPDPGLGSAYRLTSSSERHNTTPNASNTYSFSQIPRALAQKLGLLEREVLGAARGAKPIDIPGGSGFERVLSGKNIEAFNEALANGTIVVRRLRPPY